MNSCFTHYCYCFLVAHGKPKLKDLCNSIVPKYAAHWRDIGILLSLPTAQLEIIDHDFHHKARDCFVEVLTKWLDCDHTASWEKIEEITESLKNDVNTKVMKMFQLGYQKPQIVLPTLSSKPALPQKQHFSESVFMVLHEINECTKEDVVSVADALYYGNVTASDTDHLSSPHTSNYYQRCMKYTDILRLLDQLHSSGSFTLLLEGSPGIGKSTVCK